VLFGLVIDPELSLFVWFLTQNEAFWFVFWPRMTADSGQESCQNPVLVKQIAADPQEATTETQDAHFYIYSRPIRNKPNTRHGNTYLNPPSGNIISACMGQATGS
jgi:hypothetical protein